MKNRILIVLFLSSILVIQGCASKEKSLNTVNADAEMIRINDPFENVNRVVFEFNIVFDKIILRPVAITYRTIVPGFVRNRITY